MAVEKWSEVGSGGRSMDMTAGERDLVRNDGVMEARLNHPGLDFTGGLREELSNDERGRSNDGEAVDGVDAVLIDDAPPDATETRSAPPRGAGRSAARVAMKRGETPSCSSLCLCQRAARGERIRSCGVMYSREVNEDFFPDILHGVLKLLVAGARLDQAELERRRLCRQWLERLAPGRGQ